MAGTKSKQSKRAGRRGASGLVAVKGTAEQEPTDAGDAIGDDNWINQYRDEVLDHSRLDVRHESERQHTADLATPERGQQSSIGLTVAQDSPVTGLPAAPDDPFSNIGTYISAQASVRPQSMPGAGTERTPDTQHQSGYYVGQVSGSFCAPVAESGRLQTIPAGQHQHSSGVRGLIRQRHDDGMRSSRAALAQTRASVASDATSSVDDGSYCGTQSVTIDSRSSDLLPLTPATSRSRTSAGYGGFLSCDHDDCIESELTFDTPSDLTHHQRIHIPEEERPYPCSQCAKRFNFPKEQRRHELLHGTKVFVCPVCSAKTYTRPDNRNRHVVRKHPNLRVPEDYEFTRDAASVPSGIQSQQMSSPTPSTSSFGALSPVSTAARSFTSFTSSAGRSDSNIDPRIYSPSSGR